MFVIQKEFYVTIFCFFVMITCYLILITVFVDPDCTERRIGINMLCCIGPHITGLIATYWSINQFNKQERLKKQWSVPRKGPSVASNKAKKMSLEEILATKHGFDIFANHLVKEFSIENLFFVFEMVQVKYDLLAYKLRTDA